MTGTTFAPPRIETEQRSGGRLLLRSTEPLGEHPASVVHSFRAHSEAHPDRLLVAERGRGRRVGALDVGRGARAGGPDRAGPARPRPRRPAGDGALGQQPAAPDGRPRGDDGGRPRRADQRGLLAAEHRPRQAAGDGRPRRPRAGGRRGRRLRPRGRPRSAPVARSLARPLGTAVDELGGRPDRRGRPPVRGAAPTDVAKILFTSGSTGTPKGVLNTHGMLRGQPAADAPGRGRSSPTSRRCCSTGCRGATRSAATTTSTWC